MLRWVLLTCAALPTLSASPHAVHVPWLAERWGLLDLDGGKFTVVRDRWEVEHTLLSNWDLAPPSPLIPNNPALLVALLFKHGGAGGWTQHWVSWFDALHGQELHTFQIEDRWLRHGWNQCGLRYDTIRDVAYVFGCVNGANWWGLEILQVNRTSGRIDKIGSFEMETLPFMALQPTRNPAEPDNFYWVWNGVHAISDNRQQLTVWNPKRPDQLLSTNLNNRLDRPSMFHINYKGVATFASYNSNQTAAYRTIDLKTANVNALWLFPSNFTTPAVEVSGAQSDSLLYAVLPGSRPASKQTQQTKQDYHWAERCIFNKVTGDVTRCVPVVGPFPEPENDERGFDSAIDF